MTPTVVTVLTSDTTDHTQLNSRCAEQEQQGKSLMKCSPPSTAIQLLPHTVSHRWPAKDPPHDMGTHTHTYTNTRYSVAAAAA